LAASVTGKFPEMVFVEKNIFIKELKKKFKKNKPDWCNIMKQKSGINNFIVDDDKQFCILLDTPSHGVNGMYSVFMSLIITNFEIYKIKIESKIKSERKLPSIFQGNNILYPNKYIEKLWFKTSSDDIKQIDFVWNLIEKYYFPVAKGLTIDYNYILNNYDNKNLLTGFYEPFITGVILAFLTSREKWIYDILIPLTEKYKTINGSDKNERFTMDYRKSNNVEIEIIEPIRKYFKIKNGIK
jgi:hypothetical protein